MMRALRRLVAAVLVTASLTGCTWYDIYRMRKAQADMAEGYRAYCAAHVQECVDAYNRAQLNVNVNR
jgi:6-phosphogluconate dehydrogenase